MSKKKGFTEVTPVGVLSFPSLFEKKNFNQGEPKYMANLIIKKTDDGVEEWVKEVRTHAIECINAMFPDKTPNNLLMALKDGDTWKDEEGELKKSKYAEYEGCWIVTASSKTNRPGIFTKNADGDTVGLDDQEAIYAGCLGMLSFRMFAFDNVKKGISFGLRGFCKTDDGEPLGEATNIKEDFGPVAKVEAKDGDMFS